MSAINDPVYLVTGASSGIGRAVAHEIALRGFHVVAVARNQLALDRLSQACHRRVKAVAADLATTAGIDLVADAVSAGSTLAGIVHSAGSLVPLQPYVLISGDELLEHFRIHVAAPIDLYRALAETHRVGRVLFIDSYSAMNARHGWSSYSIVKAAAQMSARCAAQELPETDVIRVFPGAVNTQVVDSVLASHTETARTFAEMLSRGQFAEPREVADFIVKLLIDAPDMVIRAQEAWDYNNAEDRDRVNPLSNQA